MKKEFRNQVLAFTLMALLILLFSGCKKDNNPGNGGNNGNGITISGKIPKSKSGSGNTAKLADARKVLVFSKYYYKVYDIVNGSFTVNGQIGSGVALIFLDSNNKYIGNLAPQGLNMLPLGELTDGENTSIDLSTLTLEGTHVIPAHDPLGSEIQISPTEINCLKAIDGYYEAIAQNIDVDNDGNPDVLDNKQLVIYTMFTINGGHWGLNEVEPVPVDASHYYVNYMLEFDGGSALTFNNNNISVSGPAGDPYNDIKLWWCMKAPQCGGDRAFISSFCRETNAQDGAPWGSAFQPFKKGLYTLTLDGTRNFNLNYSNVDMQYNLIIIQPTLHTNSEGKLTSVTFKYQLPDGTPVNPGNMITNVMIQLCDAGMHQFYVNDRNKLTTLTGYDKLTFDTPIDISNLYQIDLWYDDLLGNQYYLIWR